jgi:hypothetical protein
LYFEGEIDSAISATQPEVSTQAIFSLSARCRRLIWQGNRQYRRQPPIADG